MQSSGDRRPTYRNGEDSSPSSDEGGNEVLKEATANISVEQQLKEVLYHMKHEEKHFSQIPDNERERLSGMASDPSGPTTLHIIANLPKGELPENKELKPLVEFLVKHKRNLLLEVAQDTGFTPLHCAIRQHKRSLVRWMCQYNRIQEVLSIAGNTRKQNCVHLAIASGKHKIARSLVELAAGETLALKDEDGNTPLHLAVGFEMCQEGQLELIETIVKRSDSRVRQKPGGDFNKRLRSPYTHHLDTCAEGAKKEETQHREIQDGGKAAEEEKYRRRGVAPSMTNAAKKDGEARVIVGNTQKANTAAILTTPVDKDPPSGGLQRRKTVVLEAAGSYQKPESATLARNTAKEGATRKDGQAKDSVQSGYATNSRQPAEVSIQENTSNRKTKERKDPQKANDPGPIAKVAQGEILEKIEIFLKKHYLRARGHDVALDVLYGKCTSPEKSISFDLSEYNMLTINEIKTHISILNFENILQYVDIPKVSLTEDSSKPKTKGGRGLYLSDDGDGRVEVESVFNQLRNKGVNTILKVTVDDLEQPAHTDSAIENSLMQMHVEVWDWKKVDICPDLIYGVAPDLTEVHLYWSGRNSVLRAWSEEEGLPRLTRLRKIVLHVLQGYLNSREHIEKNLQTFRTRLVKQTAGLKAKEIHDELQEVYGQVDSSSTKRAREDVSKEVQDIIKELSETLRVELVPEIVKAFEDRLRDRKKVEDKGAVMDEAKSIIKDFISTENRNYIEGENNIEALNEARRRARFKAREIAASMAESFNDLEIQVNYPERSRQTYNKSAESANGYLEEPQRHMWIECMAGFKRLLYAAEKGFERENNVKISQAIRELGIAGGPITVALIDDGIEVMGLRLDESVSLTGRSFCPKPTNPEANVPWYLSSAGHGTVMASQIHRMCPKAHLNVLKLETSFRRGAGNRRITFKSAAQAIREATRRKVHIISMSWTINAPEIENGAEVQDAKELNNAIIEAQNANILMFCSASDEGAQQADTYPSKANPGKIFKIGGATANGELYERVGDIKSVDFILPGNLVAGEELTDNAIDKVQHWSGSSIATALAAGLAALILYCAQIRILMAGPPGSRDRETATRDFELLRQHEKMETAFRNIRLSGSTGMYPAVWDLFGRKVQTSQKATFRGDHIDLLAEVAKELCTRL